MVSHNACVAGCRAEDGLKFHKFPTNAALRALWLSRIPPQYEYAKCGKKIRQKAFPKVPKLCSRHFLAEDYKVESSDKNKRRMKKTAQTNFVRAHLVENAVPSVWPGSQTSHTPVASERSTCMSLPSVRADKEIDIQRQEDTVNCLNDLKSLPFDNPANLIVEASGMSFVKVNTMVAPPEIDFCVNIRESLEYEIFFGNKSVQVTDVIVGEKSPEKVTSYSFLEQLLGALSKKSSHRTTRSTT